MSWPTHQDYNEAVQNPLSAFTDHDLKNGQPELNKMGLPRPISGNFACVYKIQNGGKPWAARCFTSEISDQQRRYEAISKHLEVVKLSYLIPFTYLPTGIKVLGKTYPLLKMQWVYGESLTVFITRCLAYPDTLFSLAKAWASMMSHLKEVNIAHGDLQHGNVVIVGDQFRLIDYDGMYVPSLDGAQSNECGHRNYQLPTRTGSDYGPYLDNFSAWVIYVSFIILAVHPELWGKYRAGDECLIFRKEDFLHPERSKLIHELNASSHAQIRILTDYFVGFFGMLPQDIPSLDGNLPAITIPSRSNAQSQNWWVDHLGRPRSNEETPVETKLTDETSDEIADPSWILDSLMENKPVERLAFQSGVKTTQFVIVGSITTLIVCLLFTETPIAQNLVLIFYTLGLDLLFCFTRYKRDSSVATLEVFKKESKNFVSPIREYQTLIDSVSAERSHVQEKFSRNENRIGTQKSNLFALFQRDLNKIQTGLTSQLQVLNKRRADAASAETNKLNSIQGTLGNQIAEIDRKVSALVQTEVDEKNSALRALQDYHVQSHLRGKSIERSRIPNISETYRTRLILNGFTTAFDINWRIGNVEGIGPKRKTALFQWRQGIENEARRHAPQLSQQEKLAIEEKYRQQRQSLEMDKQRLKTQFDSQISSARQFASNVRQALVNEEQQCRFAYEQKMAHIKNDHDLAISALNQELSAVRSRAAPAINELSQKIQSIQKQIIALRWQAAKREKEEQRFTSLSFKNYLRWIISS